MMDWSDGQDAVLHQGAYQTPEGFHDVPFIYLFNGNTLTDGAIARNLSVALENDDFILRRIVGVHCLTEGVIGQGFFSFRYPDGTYVFSQPIPGGAANTKEIVVVPEIRYPANTSIVFDAGPIDRQQVGVPDPVAFLGFQGVRRMRGPDPLGPPQRRYRLRPQIYTLAIPAISWTSADPPQLFFVSIGNYDFELYRITNVDTTAGALGDPNYGFLNYSLYDSFGFRLMNAPVPDSYIIDSPIRTAGVTVASPGIFPVPPVVYPANSVIRLDAASVRTVAPAESFQLAFHGAERIPC